MGQPDQHVLLDPLQGRRVVVPAIEVLVVRPESLWAPLGEDFQVGQDRVRELHARAAHEREQGHLKPLDDGEVHLRVVPREVQVDLRRREDDGAVRVLQEGVQVVHDPEHFLLAGRLVSGGKAEDRALPPLVELPDPLEEGQDELPLGGQAAPVRVHLVEAAEGIDRHGRLAVGEHRLERLAPPAGLERVGRDPEEPRAAHGGRLADVRGGVLHARAEQGDDVLDDRRELQRAQAPQREPADHGIVVLCVFPERVDRQDGEVLLLLRVVAEVEVDHLFQDEVLGVGQVDHLREELRDVDPKRHVRDHLFGDFALLLLVPHDFGVPEVPAQLIDLPTFVVDEVRGLWHLSSAGPSFAPPRLSPGLCVPSPRREREPVPRRRRCCCRCRCRRRLALRQLRCGRGRGRGRRARAGHLVVAARRLRLGRRDWLLRGAQVLLRDSVRVCEEPLWHIVVVVVERDRGPSRHEAVNGTRSPV
mmetsp:Transcript_17792/g.43542  ORF Transcript_17792/g.43542 Transcript_17792/m.43542 type:complete len:475 (-) Transcript_17792:640-2064(-)